MSISLSFLGAAGGVTGSATLLKTSRAAVLIDFGMFQGGKTAESLNHLPDQLAAANVDTAVITHGHLDHCGRLPLLARSGGPAAIRCTQATSEISALILRDSAKVQAHDLARTNRKRERAGDPPLNPLYTAQDVEHTLPRFQSVPYDEPVPIAPGVQARYVEAGHMLGSASIQLLVENGARTMQIAFSGDLGPHGAPLLKDAVGFDRSDVVVMESTYGDHDHKPLEETVSEFENVVKEAYNRRAKILVPAFAVGRTQLLLYLLAIMFRKGIVPKFPIYLDSPMAIEASRIYQHHLELFDDDFQALGRERPVWEDLTSVHTTATPEESKALNDLTGPCMIIAGAGMCNAGRILHHLKANLWKSETYVLIVGFQAEGTIGRQLIDRADSVKIFGEKIAVRARVHTLGGFSAHAGQSDLLRWIGSVAHCRPRVILNHGEPKGRDPLARLIQERYSLTCAKPMLGDTIEL
jgi:metallo-beta-lactamase family protein